MRVIVRDRRRPGLRSKIRKRQRLLGLLMGHSNRRLVSSVSAQRNAPCRRRAYVHDDSTKRRAASEASWKEKATELILGGLMPSWRCQGFLNSFFNRRTTRLFCRARTPFGRPPKDCGCWPVTIPSAGYPPGLWAEGSRVGEPTGTAIDGSETQWRGRCWS